MSKINPYDCVPIDWRFEKILHLKSICHGDHANDDFRDFCEDLSLNDDNNKHLFDAFPFIKHAFDDEGELHYNEAIEELFYENPKEGYLVKIAATVPSYRTDSIYSSSWGYYQTKWIYVSAIEEAEISAALMSKELHDEAKAKVAS